MSKKYIFPTIIEGDEEYEGEEPEPEDNSNYPPEYWHTFEEFRPDE